MSERIKPTMTHEQTVAFLLRGPPPNEDRKTSVERAQTSMMQWLRLRGHQVDFSPEPDVVDFIRDHSMRVSERRARFNQPISAGYSTPKMLKDADGTSCPYCSHIMEIGSRRPPTRDHVRPKRAGGTLTPGNVLIVCGPCNNDKGDMMLLEFAAWLEMRNDKRAALVRKIPHDFGVVDRPGGESWRE